MTKLGSSVVTTLLFALGALPSCADEKEGMEDRKAKAAAIHPGMTRAEIESRMMHDGGLAGIFHGERLYFPSGGKLCMLNIDFRPYGVSVAIFNDPDKMAQWIRKNGVHLNPKDVAFKVSAPFIDVFHND